MKRTERWSLPFLVEHKRTPQLELVASTSSRGNDRTLNLFLSFCFVFVVVAAAAVVVVVVAAATSTTGALYN